MKSIRVIALILYIVIIGTAESKMNIEQLSNAMKPFKNTCVKKLSVDEALVNGSKSGQFPEDQGLMCFFRCFLQIIKVMKDGKINVDSLQMQVDIMLLEEYADRLKKVSLACEKTVSEKKEPCEIAFEFSKCLYDTAPELYFLP